MRTQELIERLKTEAGGRATPLPSAMAAAVGLAILATAVLCLALLGPRPDLAVVAATPRFALKLVLALVLTSAALVAVRDAGRPGAPFEARLRWLWLAPVLLSVAVALDLAAAGSGDWSARLFGDNSVACLVSIVALGAVPLALFVVFLRHGAPTRPALAGAAAGLLAGGISAGFYAVHCPDDSPLFVAAWYTPAVLGLAVVGALAARSTARW